MLISFEILEQGWVVQCQFEVTGWGIMFICGISVCWHRKPGLSLDQLQQI